MLFSGGGVLSVQHLLVGITSNGAFSYCYESANSRWQKQWNMMFWGHSADHLSVCCAYINTTFTWTISLLNGGISAKLAADIHHVTGHCWKDFQGQRSRSRPSRHGEAYSLMCVIEADLFCYLCNVEVTQIQMSWQSTWWRWWRKTSQSVSSSHLVKTSSISSFKTVSRALNMITELQRKEPWCKPCY